MGYQTSYELEIQNADEKTMEGICQMIFHGEHAEDIPFALDECSITEEHECPRCFGEGVINVYTGGTQIETAQECKWYEHERHMKEISLTFPEVIFVLDGRGEDGDVWRKFFKNGEIRKAEVEVKITNPDMSDW